MADLRSLRVPMCCPVCGSLMKGSKSTASWYDFQCCINCRIWFLEHSPKRQEDWKNGWRPSEEEILKMKEGMGLI